jgi:hypothetical protein
MNIRSDCGQLLMFFFLLIALICRPLKKMGTNFYASLLKYPLEDYNTLNFNGMIFLSIPFKNYLYDFSRKPDALLGPL